jgi:cell division septal protein FtsQ
LDIFVYRNADFAVQHIEVQTDGVIAPEQLRRWSGVKIGMNLIGLDLAAVKRNLELVSEIDSVSVERVLPRTLKIRVTEREPLAQVNVPRTDAAGAISLSIFQLDANGVVIMPLNSRARLLTEPAKQLPVIEGMNLLKVWPGRRMESPQVLAALRLITAFEKSPMAGLVDLRRLDVSAPGVVMVTTGQGGQITFALDNLDQQLRRWREIYDFGMREQKSVAALDLAVGNNVPVRWIMTDTAGEKTDKTSPIRKRNV